MNERPGVPVGHHYNIGSHKDFIYQGGKVSGFEALPGCNSGNTAAILEVIITRIDVKHR